METQLLLSWTAWASQEWRWGEAEGRDKPTHTGEEENEEDESVAACRTSQLVN